MTITFNVETLMTAVKAPLLADATLSNSSYLNGSNKIFNGKAPRDGNIKNPYVVVSLDQWAGETSYGLGELRVTNYCELLPNGQIDPKGNLILNRCQELLNNAVLTITGSTIQPLLCLGVIPHFWDPQDLSKSRGLVRFRIEGGTTG